MSWQIAVLLQILVGHALIQFLIKKYAVTGSRTRKLVWQYSVLASIALVAAFFFEVDFHEKNILLVVALGICNAFACYAHWRAYDISMHRTSLFTQADDLIGLALGYIVLKEGKFLNETLSLGLILIGIAIAIFVRENPTTDRPENASQDGKTNLALWIAAYSVVWGLTVFSMRYFALGGMPVQNYLIGWYVGSFFGSLLVFAFAGKTEKGPRLSSKQLAQMALLAIALGASLGIGYWCRALAPLTVVQPIDQVAEMVLPTILGLWVFKEIRALTKLSWVAIVLGLAGGIAISFSY